MSTVLRQSGTAPEGFQHNVLAHNFTKLGSKVDKLEELKRGDIVNFTGTYKPKHGLPSTHTGIYLGDGRFAHRSTADRPEVRVNSFADRLKSGKTWGDHFLQGSRFEGNSTGVDQPGVKFTKFNSDDKPRRNQVAQGRRSSGTSKKSSSRARQASRPKPQAKPSKLSKN